MIRVLIVDDDKLARKGLISIMPWKAYGMEVVGDVSNGAKALEFLKDHAVDLMFVDLEMPVMSGIELIKKTYEAYPGVAFVVLTFHESFEYIQTALRLGALDYISKAELEVENYAQTFQRIVKRLNEIKKDSASAGQYSTETASNEKTVLNADKWDEITRDWYNLYWLYDDELFESLCIKLENSEMPLPYVEQFFIKLVVMIELATGIKNDISLNITDMKSAVEWMLNYRESLCEKASQSSDLSKLPMCMLKAKSYLKDNSNLRVREDDVANYVNMSRSYFSQSFKKITGITFNDYIKKERINMAKKLLVETDEPLEKIAQSVGYEDVKHFCQVFYQQVNIKPSEFRKH